MHIPKVKKMNREEREPISDDVKRASDIVKRGGVILYPTDTVWGIGCDARRPEAVKRVFEIKRRADSKALIILVNNIEQLNRYVDEVPEVALQIIELATKPTTIIYDRGINLAPEVIAENGSVAVRVTNEKISGQIIGLSRCPLVSTSANISGMPAPACFSEISQEIIDAVDYVVESRREEKTNAKPSSIIRIGNDLSFKIIRE